MEQEVWIPVRDYPRYEVSNLGKVKNITTGLFLKNTLLKIGYHQVATSNENGRKKWYIHRLVALHFVPNPSQLPNVDHINRDRLDNRASNLRWCNQSQNTINQSSRQERRLYSRFRGVTFNQQTQKWVAQITHKRKHISIGYFETEAEAGRAYNKKAVELFGEYANLNEIDD